MQQPTRAHITRTEAREALIRSGYLLEHRVEQRLANSGYYVDANTAFLDPETLKSREIDVHALAASQVTHRLDFVWNVLLIECVNNPQPLVLLTKEPQVGFLFFQELRLAGVPAVLAPKKEGEAWQSLHDALGLAKFHHYCVERVATQFCSFTRKGQDEWMAQHEGSQFDAFKKLCDAVDFAQDQHFKSWYQGGPEHINVEFYYPILVIQGELLEALPSQSGVSLRRSNHLQYRRSVVRGTEVSTYQIDIVTERGLPKLLEQLQDELDTIRKRVAARKKRFYESIATIITGATAAATPDRVRQALEHPG